MNRYKCTTQTLKINWKVNFCHTLHTWTDLGRKYVYVYCLYSFESRNDNRISEEKVYQRDTIKGINMYAKREETKK